MVKLSICIPTRNRQKYCISAIEWLSKSKNRDFEVVIGDNSDDDRPLKDFFDNFDDDRFTLVPPGERVYSMVENWERLVQFTRGEWVSYIGDDDYIDTELTRLIAGIQEVEPDVDVVDWFAIFYTWPEIQPEDCKIITPLGTEIQKIGQKRNLERLFYWKESSDRPVCAFGIYHGAIKRELLEQIKATFSGYYFEHQTVDYESICKTIMLAKSTVLVERPMSIMGACSKSNSASTVDKSLVAERAKTFRQEVDASERTFLKAKNFPFNDNMGVTAAAAAVIVWFTQKYELEVKGWEKDFVKACEKYVENIHDKDEFDLNRKKYTKALRSWKAGRHMKHFSPKFHPPEAGVDFQGFYKKRLYISSQVSDIQSAGELLEFLKCVLPPVDVLLDRLNGKQDKAA